MKIQDVGKEVAKAVFCEEKCGELFENSRQLSALRRSMVFNNSHISQNYCVDTDCNIKDNNLDDDSANDDDDDDDDDDDGNKNDGSTKWTCCTTLHSSQSGPHCCSFS